MGEVYRAEDTTLKRHVALKVLPPETAGDPDRLRRFRREVEAVATLNHPNIVVIHSVEAADGVHVFTMELVKSETLERVIHREGLPLGRLLDLAIPLADALAAAHERGIVHRDLKPGNIMVTVDGRVKILDFGLAKLRPRGAPGASQVETATAAERGATQSGAVVGTVPYMSPEQARGQAVDHRSDIFSLGVVLYELATGRRPFQGATWTEVVSSILRDTPAAVTHVRGDLPREVSRIVGLCLEKDPADRYQSVLDLRNELKGLRRDPESGELFSQAPQGSLVPGLGGPGRGARRARLAVGLAALAAVTAGFYLGLVRGRPRSSAAGVSRIDSIVALPSKVYAEAHESYLTDAIPNTLSTHLTQVAGLETKVPPTSIEVERVGGDFAKLAAVYGVSAFVLSTVTADSERFVLTVQLVEARSRSLLWSRVSKCGGAPRTAAHPVAMHLGRGKAKDPLADGMRTAEASVECRLRSPHAGLLHFAGTSVGP